MPLGVMYISPSSRSHALMLPQVATVRPESIMRTPEARTSSLYSAFTFPAMLASFQKVGREEPEWPLPPKD